MFLDQWKKAFRNEEKSNMEDVSSRKKFNIWHDNDCLKLDENFSIIQ